MELWVYLQTDFLLYYSYYISAKDIETVIKYLHGDGTHNTGVVIHQLPSTLKGLRAEEERKYTTVSTANVRTVVVTVVDCITLTG